MGKDADELAAVVGRTRQTLDAFANEIDTVRSRMRQAREVAAAARLIVTPTAILPPGPGPGAAPTHPMGPMNPPAEAAYTEAVAAHQAAVAAHAAKVAAFTEASATVGEARQMEADAHRKLDAAMNQGDVDTGALKTVGMAVVGAGLGTIGGLQNAANDLLRQAEKISDHANRMQALAVEATAAHSTRGAAAQAARAALDGEARTRAEAGRYERPIRTIPEPIRQGIGNNPGNYIRDGNRWVGLGQSVGKRLPYVGTGVTIVSGGADVAMGKRWARQRPRPVPASAGV